MSPIKIFKIHKNETLLKDILKNLRKRQLEDSRIKGLMDLIHNNNQISHYELFEGILFHKQLNEDNWRIVIPEILKKELTIITHERLGHPRVYKTANYMENFYYWKSMSRDVKKYVRSCDLCQRVKYLTIAMEGEYQLVRAENPGDLATVDFYGPLSRARGGVQFLLVVLDAFSKLVRLYPLKRATTRASITRLKDNYFPECGKPKRLLSNNGTQFTANKWKQV